MLHRKHVQRRRRQLHERRLRRLWWKRGAVLRGVDVRGGVRVRDSDQQVHGVRRDGTAVLRWDGL